MNMKMVFFITLLWCHCVIGQGVFSNLREGPSRFIGEAEKVRIMAMYQKYGQKNLENRFSDMFQTEKVATCASRIIQKLSELEQQQEGRASLAYAIRDLDIIDDIALDIILKHNQIEYTRSFPSLSRNSVKENKIREDFYTFKSDLSDGLCPEDAYIHLVRSLYKKGYSKNSTLKAANAVAKSNGFISKNRFKTLESFRRSKVHEWSLTLRTYRQKLLALRRHVDSYGHEDGDFVTKENKKAKMSLRQYLYSNYSYLQILMMGELAQKMRKRLDSTDISILIRYADDQQTEVIPLEPMERFRFVLKLIRKEMAEINSTNSFKYSKATYAVVIAASYEVGAVAAIELEELSSLEEIWNPKRSRKDRMISWAKMFGGVASVVLPGPLGLLPVLAVMVVDGVVTQPKPARDQDISLF